MMSNCIPGFTCERQDPVSGSMHQGNGYRAYNPVLMRFNTPDSWSPFGPGGINAYLYCIGDPVNRTDPAGHFSIGGVIGLGLGILSILLTPVFAGTSLAAAVSISAVAAGAVSVGLGVASEVVHDRKTANILGWTGVALGFVSGLGAGVMSKLAPGARSLAGLLASKWPLQMPRASVTAETEMSSMAGTRAAQATTYIHAPENFSHEIELQGGRGSVITSVHTSSETEITSNFTSYFSPELWIFKYLRRDPAVSAFYTDDIIDYQATMAARHGGYPLQAPRKIILKDVIHKGLSDYKPGVYSPTKFYNSTNMGRMIQRVAQRYEINLTQVEVVSGRAADYSDIARINFNLYFSPVA